MRTKRTFEVKWNAFFIIFKGHSVAKNCLRPESAPLSAFKSEIKKWWPQNCLCRLCKRYLPNIGFIQVQESNSEMWRCSNGVCSYSPYQDAVKSEFLSLLIIIIMLLQVSSPCFCLKMSFFFSTINFNGPILPEHDIM